MRPMTRILAAGCVLGTALAWAVPAAAGGYGHGYYQDRYQQRYDDGRYCDGDRCYRSDDGYGRYDNDNDNDDDDYGGNGGYYRGGYYGDRYGGGRRYVCDSDGDRCYTAITTNCWNYREYYRRHGYRWEN